MKFTYICYFRNVFPHYISLLYCLIPAIPFLSPSFHSCLLWFTLTLWLEAPNMSVLVAAFCNSSRPSTDSLDLLSTYFVPTSMLDMGDKIMIVPLSSLRFEVRSSSSGEPKCLTHTWPIADLPKIVTKNIPRSPSAP